MTIEDAKLVRLSYNMGMITYEEAKEKLQSFIINFNNKSREIAKKYGQKPKLFSFTSFMR